MNIIMQQKGKNRPKDKSKNKKNKEEEAPKQTQQKQEEKAQSKQDFTLYSLLEVGKDASFQDIKKQYRKLVLKYHPDKNQDDPSARQKFQKLKEAYDILTDPEKRKQYDETGSIGEDFNESTFQAAYNYFRNIYKKVSSEDIQSFSEKYRFGEMEKEDLVNYYKQHNGDMKALIQSIPLSSNEDIPRFMKFFEQEIANERLPKYKAFDKTKNKVREIKDETAEFQEQKKKNMGALVAAIKGKSSKTADFIASLEQKFGVGKKNKADSEIKKLNKKK